MNIDYNTPVKDYKTCIRSINLNNIILGGEYSLPFMHHENKTASKQIFAIEMQTVITDKYPPMLKEFWGDWINNPILWAKQIEKTGAEVLAVRFNIANQHDIESEILKSKDILVKILESVSIPVIIIGSDRDEIDVKLIPELAKSATRKCTIGFINEDNYKQIIPLIKTFGHNIIAKTPIDINLAKELNIFLTEMGINPDCIIIDPNMGALGYGIDYAYSVVERIKMAAFSGDIMLNMPIAAFVGHEVWKTKEAKSTNTPEGWGETKTRAIGWECITASSIISAGADLIVLNHPESMNYLKNFIEKA
jgi:acetyl-CoA decarbonylase/synthase complex subunit delta